jgi:hypothetical protein
MSASRRLGAPQQSARSTAASLEDAPHHSATSRSANSRCDIAVHHGHLFTVVVEGCRAPLRASGAEQSTRAQKYHFRNTSHTLGASPLRSSLPD